MTNSIYKIATLTAALGVAGIALPAQAQPKPGNCQILAEMAADTVKKDKRAKGADAKAAQASLKKFAKAQQALKDAQMPDAYKQAKAMGWDKAKVDAMMKDGEQAIRAGFQGPTMEKNKIYMDHIVALNGCAGKATQKEIGQSKEELTKTLQDMMAWAQG